MILTLKGITRHGKNRIREHGDTWIVIPSAVTPKPSDLFIESTKTGDRRWLLLNHFEIVENKS